MLSTYSYSALNTFRTCPRKFKFQYVEKLDVPKRVTADTYLGNAVHRTLARLYQLGSDGIVWPLEDTILFYRDEWEKLDRKTITLIDEYHTVDDYIRLGEEMLARYYERYQPFDEGTLLGTELRLRLSLPDTPFKFTAIIDRLWKRDDGVVEIRDYKTGRRLAKPHEEAFLYQMGLYQLAVQENYPQFEKIELAQHFLRMDEVVSYRMRLDELEELTEDIRVTVVEAIEAERLDEFPPKESPLCHYCAYSSLCPAKRHQLTLEEAKRQSVDSGRTPEEEAYELATRFIEVDRNKKQLEAEHKVLKSELIETARVMDVTKIVGENGDIRVTFDPKEEFVTKTKAPGEFAELSHLARQLDLDEYFVLDGKALMKDVYRKRRLDEEELVKLKEFVVEAEHPRVTAKLKQERESGED